MTSIARVDKIQKVADSSNIINKTGTDITLGQTGDDIIVPAGATITNNGTAVGFDTDTNDKVKVTTNDTTAGFLTSKILAGTNITLATGSPGGNETLTINTSPSLEWQTSIVTATTLTAVAGKGYWINTTSNVCTITLPASASVGDQIIFVDYARTWATNAVTINQNSLKFQGFTSPNPVYDTIGQTLNIVYSGATQGWIPISDDAVANETPQPLIADFLVIAGGGGGSRDGSGGGGAGGYRASFNSEASGGGGSSESAITLTAGEAYTAVVGAGGAGGTGANGVNSSLSGDNITTITSIGGGAAGQGASGTANGLAGGSGGGAKGSGNGGAGTSNQGFAGGGGNSTYITGGGGGAGAVGGTGVVQRGGVGVASTISGSSVTRAGGGVGYFDDASAGIAALAGGAGTGAYISNAGTAVTANTGAGGAGGGAQTGYLDGLVGAAGVVILRLPTSQYTGTTSGSPTITTSGSDTIITFNANGTYTA